MTSSSAYADLGGLTVPPRSPRYPSRAVDHAPGRVCDHHLFDPISGWCGCGLRDDGRTAPGSPAWRAALERHLPDPAPKDPDQ